MKQSMKKKEFQLQKKSRRLRLCGSLRRSWLPFFISVSSYLFFFFAIWRLVLGLNVGFKFRHKFSWLVVSKTCVSVVFWCVWTQIVSMIFSDVWLSLVYFGLLGYFWLTMVVKNRNHTGTVVLSVGSGFCLLQPTRSETDWFRTETILHYRIYRLVLVLYEPIVRTTDSTEPKPNGGPNAQA